MSKHVFHFYGPVTPHSVENFRNVILNGIYQQNATEVCIYISSDGGDLTSGFTAYNFLRNLPVEVTTINMGNVQSIAVIMYLAGKNRYAVKDSRFLLHSLHWNAPSPIDHARLNEYSLSLDYDKQRYIDIFTERTCHAQKTLDVCSCLNGTCQIISSASAIDYGITTATTTSTTFSTDDVHWWPNICG